MVIPSLPSLRRTTLRVASLYRYGYSLCTSRPDRPSQKRASSGTCSPKSTLNTFAPASISALIRSSHHFTASGQVKSISDPRPEPSLPNACSYGLPLSSRIRKPKLASSACVAVFVAAHGHNHRPTLQPASEAERTRPPKSGYRFLLNTKREAGSSHPASITFTP